MGHEDKGHYSAKHKDVEINETIAEKLRSAADSANITCAFAHKLGQSLETSPSDIGVQIDLLEYRITECQLGLFGYTNGKKRLDAEIEIGTDLSGQLDKSNQEGEISCSECWNIAKRLKINRLDIGSACEKKNIRIKPCQLGAF